MGAIKMLNQLLGDIPEIKEAWQPVSPEEVVKGHPIIKDAVPITLAEYNVETKDAITAHRLQDYRRRTFKLTLLPKCDILFDVILEGSDYWRELLQVEGHFS